MSYWFSKSDDELGDEQKWDNGVALVIPLDANRDEALERGHLLESEGFQQSAVEVDRYSEAWEMVGEEVGVSGVSPLLRSYCNIDSRERPDPPVVMLLPTRCSPPGVHFVNPAPSSRRCQVCSVLLPDGRHQLLADLFLRLEDVGRGTSGRLIGMGDLGHDDPGLLQHFSFSHRCLLVDVLGVVRSVTRRPGRGPACSGRTSPDVARAGVSAIGIGDRVAGHMAAAARASETALTHPVPTQPRTCPPAGWSNG